MRCLDDNIFCEIQAIFHMSMLELLLVLHLNCEHKLCLATCVLELDVENMKMDRTWNLSFHCKQLPLVLIFHFQIQICDLPVENLFCLILEKMLRLNKLPSNWRNQLHFECKKDK